MVTIVCAAVVAAYAAAILWSALYERALGRAAGKCRVELFDQDEGWRWRILQPSAAKALAESHRRADEAFGFHFRGVVPTEPWPEPGKKRQPTEWMDTVAWSSEAYVRRGGALKGIRASMQALRASRPDANGFLKARNGETLCAVKRGAGRFQCLVAARALADFLDDQRSIDRTA